MYDASSVPSAAWRTSRISPEVSPGSTSVRIRPSGYIVRSFKNDDVSDGANPVPSGPNDVSSAADDNNARRSSGSITNRLTF